MTLKIHGAPGTGKTYKTIQILKEAVNSGIPAENIMYTTYRKEATADAITQISKETGLPAGKLRKTVKTIHGMCLSLLLQNGLIKLDGNVNPIFNEFFDIPKFNKEYGYNIKVSRSAQDAVFSGNMDPHLSAYTLLRSTRTPLSKAYSIPMTGGLTLAEFKQFVKDLEEWKEKHNKIGYDDMIDLTIKEDLCPDCSIQIYDEAQDMTTQLHDVAQMWANEANEVILAGDPLQTLYPFWGADPAYFMNWEGETEILPVSRRLPGDVWSVASDLIADRTPYKTPDIKTRPESGMVRQINRARLEPWISRNPHSHNSSVFHLVRTTYAGLDVAQMLARLGIPYSGMSSYSWTPEERNLYNAIKAIQSFKQISPAEFCAIVDYYPATLTGAPRNPGELMELKKGIMSGQIPPTLSYFKQSLIENLKSNEPLRYSKNTNKLTEMKIKGALNRGIQKISENDLQKTQLLTIHGAKGLEANTVFLYNGITRAIQLSMHTPKGIENEAYIWYVGITRARDRLFFVTYNRDGYSIPGVCA